MHCIDASNRSTVALPARRRLLAGLGAALGGLQAACGSSPALSPGEARAWEDFKIRAAQRMVAANPAGTYMGDPPEILLGIPVIEIEVNRDGSVSSLKVLRRPSDEAARDTVQIALEAIRRSAPYGDMSGLVRPWKWVEVFLFNERRQFKPRALDN